MINVLIRQLSMSTSPPAEAEWNIFLGSCVCIVMVLVFIPLSYSLILKFVLPKTILDLLPLFDDRTLKDGLTVFCFVLIESISLLNPGSEHEEQSIFVCHSGTWGSIHHPCQWPNCNLAWVTTDTSAENTPWNCVAPSPLGPSAPLPPSAFFPAVHWGSMTVGWLCSAFCFNLVAYIITAN